MNNKFKNQTQMESKFKIGDVVANIEHKTVGVVIDVFDRGDVRTDADGVVDERDIVPYDKVKHANYQIAPSTKAKMQTENVQSRNTAKIRKLISLIVENEIRKLSNAPDSQPLLNRDEFLEAVRNYGTYKESVFRSNDLKRVVSEIRKIVESVEEITLQESDGWFDSITVNRHMKQLKESYKVLEKTCDELVTSQQRFESAYNDIGHVLENYYDV